MKRCAGCAEQKEGIELTVLEVRGEVVEVCSPGCFDELWKAWAPRESTVGRIRALLMAIGILHIGTYRVEFR